jgi:gluconolactonase
MLSDANGNGAAVELLDPRMEKIAIPGSVVRRLGGDATWSEGPVYLPKERAVIWSDIPGNRILRWSEDDGAITEWRSPSDFTNGHTLDHEGRIIHCSHGARAVLRTEHDGTVTTLVSHYRHARLNSPNDVVVASDGSIWFTDPPYGIRSDHEGYKADPEIPGCYVYRFEPETERLDAIVTDMIYPNGLAFSRDEKILYVTDTSEVPFGDLGFHHLRAYDIENTDGKYAATNGRLFAEIRPGLPDGFRLDTAGNLYISSLDAIQVYAPDGTRIGRIPVPERVANCCWGGPDRRTLFITASSSLYAIDLLASDTNASDTA